MYRSALATRPHLPNRTLSLLSICLSYTHLNLVLAGRTLPVNKWLCDCRALWQPERRLNSHVDP